MKLPTKKQKELLNFIATFISGNGYAPSYREIMRGMGYSSVATVAKHLDNMEAKGLIKKGEGPRSLTIADAKETETVITDDLFNRVDSLLSRVKDSQASMDQLAVVIQALDLLGYTKEAQEYRKQAQELFSQPD